MLQTKLETVKRSSQEWSDLSGIEVMDPDGWDRKGDFHGDWAKPITFGEFLYKASSSTTNRWPCDSIENLIDTVLSKV